MTCVTFGSWLCCQGADKGQGLHGVLLSRRPSARGLGNHQGLYAHEGMGSGVGHLPLHVETALVDSRPLYFHDT